MEADIGRILLSQDQIRSRIREMAAEIAAVYESANGQMQAGLTIVPILSGSIIFLADLMRELPLKMKIAMVQVSSYPGTATTSQAIHTPITLSSDLAGRHVLLLDDILDSGRTIRHVQALIRERRPASLRTAVLLRKPDKAPADVPVEFVGFDIEDAFVVGYGLDFDDHYRNYPHIGVLRPELQR
jgi:hypoxanthine phosphoribosyltransferase